MIRFAEIISIGDEILSGSTPDTNAHWLTNELTDMSISVIRRHTISDDKDEIVHAIKSLSAITDIAILTGGLGPTRDDITKKTITEYFGGNLFFSDEQYQNIIIKLKQRNPLIPASNKEQAFIPDNAEILPNSIGTAAGLLFNDKGRRIYVLPGVPSEMKQIFTQSIKPVLKQLSQNLFKTLVFRTTGIMESEIVDRIDHGLKNFRDIKVGYYPSVFGVTLKIRLKHDDHRNIETIRAFIFNAIGDYIFAEDNRDLTEVVAGLLIAKGWKLAVAESCTGGLISHRITENPGSSGYFLEGRITYSNESKNQLLGVSLKTIDTYGAVSKETVIEMAEGLKKSSSAHVVLTISGIAGPDGGTAEKPVGTVWICVMTPDRTETRKILFNKSRTLNKAFASQAALDLLRRNLI
jgi:nicotinamide-nucleotide amidase